MNTQKLNVHARFFCGEVQKNYWPGENTPQTVRAWLDDDTIPSSRMPCEFTRTPSCSSRMPCDPQSVTSEAEQLSTHIPCELRSMAERAEALLVSRFPCSSTHMPCLARQSQPSPSSTWP